MRVLHPRLPMRERLLHFRRDHNRWAAAARVIISITIPFRDEVAEKGVVIEDQQITVLATVIRIVLIRTSKGSVAEPVDVATAQHQQEKIVTM